MAGPFDTAAPQTTDSMTFDGRSPDTAERRDSGPSESAQNEESEPTGTASKERQHDTADESRPKKKQQRKAQPKPRNPSLPRCPPTKERAKRQKSPTTPLPPPPTQVTQAVANKIRQVREFSATKRPSLLERDPKHTRFVFVPELGLLGTLMIMRVHYEIGNQHAASFQDVANIMAKQASGHIGEQRHKTNWITLDVSRRSELEETIHEKVAHHGLEHINLLETELEMYYAANQKRAAGLPLTEESHYTLEGFAEKVAEQVKRLRDQKNTMVDDTLAEQSSSEEREVGRVGACVAPKHEHV